MAGTKFAFDEIVAAICAEYEDVAGSNNSSSFQSFLFAAERLGLSRADARKCREMTGSFTLGIAESGNWRLARLSAKTDEDYRREMTFVLGFLARFIPPAQDTYPEAMQEIKISILLPETDIEQGHRSIFGINLAVRQFYNCSRAYWYKIVFIITKLGLDHRVGHPTPFSPIPMLVAAD